MLSPPSLTPATPKGSHFVVCLRLQTLSDVQYLAARPLPTAPDGRYDAEVVPVTAATTDNDPHSDLYRATKNMITNLKNVAPIMQEALDPTVHMTVNASHLAHSILVPHFRRPSRL